MLAYKPEASFHFELLGMKTLFNEKNFVKKLFTNCASVLRQFSHLLHLLAVMV